jgi:surfactin synthase thioesterase subunit
MKNRKDRISVLKNFSKQKIMICGIQDPIVSFNDCKTMAYETKSDLEILDGGHMGLIENFNEIVKIVTLS